MKVSYYPGCTLKTKAMNLDVSARRAMEVLGVDMEELPRWNCCGAVYSLTDDDLIHQIAPVRVLARALEQGSDQLLTLCPMCYNTLARANLLMRTDEEKRHTINSFMEEEPDYHGEVEVLHLLGFLKNQIGWDAVREKITTPLTGLKLAPYYGCTLLRPEEVAIESPQNPALFGELMEVLGAQAVHTPTSADCCGSYQVIGNPLAATAACHWHPGRAADRLHDAAPGGGIRARPGGVPLRAEPSENPQAARGGEADCGPARLARHSASNRTLKKHRQ